MSALHRIGIYIFATALVVLIDTSAFAQDTTFTYQGQLRQTGQPFTGIADLEFALYDALTDGSEIGLVQSLTGVPIEDGLFSVELDFGEGAFEGGERYLEIRVDGAVLNPRQRMTATPYSLLANRVASGAISGTNNAASANDSTVSGGRNNIASGDYSSIGGGFSNDATGALSTVCGGIGNDASGIRSLACGGQFNTASGARSVVTGGESNVASGDHSFIGGGQFHIASGWHSTIGGGRNNRTTNNRSTVAGGVDNIAGNFGSTVSGGAENTASGHYSTVGGGSSNTASGRFSIVSGGSGNCAGGDHSWAGGSGAKVRPGSNLSDPGMGCLGVPNTGETPGDVGTFVWAGSGSGSFVSTGSHQFLIRARNGVGIGTNAPLAQLHVVGDVLGSAFDLGSYAAIIENSNTAPQGPEVLALKTGQTNPTNTANFITFFDGDDDALGRIEGNGSGGVQFISGGADFAEWLPKRDPDEVIGPGDVIGWHPDGISLDTQGALRVMAVSTAPIVVGNSPGEDERQDWAQVGFIGQVPVRVLGAVHAGDWIIASGHEDGTGVAVAPASIRVADLHRVIGQALESIDTEGDHQVNVAIGLGAHAAIGQTLAQLWAENSRLQARLERVEQQQTEELAALREELALLRTVMSPQLAQRESE